MTSHAQFPPASTTDYLTLDVVTKRYGGKAVVKGVSLSVARGEVLTILGPSGCGKTTTLKMIAGFLEPDDGSVSVDGARVDKLSSHQRGAAMVFQNYALFPHMTVRRNVAFGLRMQRKPAAEIAREVDAMLARVRLSEFAERYPRELSGGQQQRVALARALIIRPKILLLDEPFSSLDAKLRKQLRSEFLEIHRNFGITSVFVTHDLEEAFAISDRVAVMNTGVLEQFGSPTEIFSRPRTRFVADFVGHKNIFTGEAVASADGGSVLAADGLSIRLPAAASGEVDVSIPVHRVRVSRTALDTGNAFRGDVETVAYLGPVVQTTVLVGATRIESYLSASPELETLRSGDKVEIGWDVEDAVVIPGAGPA
ncbi:MAG: ABC transporter ATP-binding protein [Rhizobiaceae bacterium]